MANFDQTKTGGASARQGVRAGKGRPRKAPVALPGITADLEEAPAPTPFVAAEIAPATDVALPVIPPAEPALAETETVTEKPSLVTEDPVAQVPAPSFAVSEPEPTTPTDEAVTEASFPAITESLVSAPAPLSPIANPFSLKDLTMNTNFNGFQDVITEAQAKAQAAFEKSSSAMGEVSEFAKGNVEAAIESGKIFASGFQDLGSTIAAEGRTAFETMTADIKELAAVKSPTDFMKVQSEIARKNFDTAVAYGSKNSEAMLKLLTDAFAPLSSRVSLAVEKARTTATV